MRHAALCLILIAAVPAFSVPTTVTVRAISRDAKVIGSGVGGAKITIRDVATGRLLAEGIQLGGTGQTPRIMQPRERYGTVFGTEGTAAFVTTIDIPAPTLVEITAEGPLTYPQATGRASKTILLVPGEHITGEGVLLEIHGFVIDIEEATPERIRMRMVMT